MAVRSAPSADPATAEAIGEVRGQMRELIHSVNNLGQRNEANSRILLKLEDTPDRLDKIDLRLIALETAEHRREGATSLWQTVLKSPFLAWITAIAVGGWALLTGKVQA